MGLSTARFLRFLLVVSLVSGLPVLVYVRPVLAASAADKATARELATDAIQHFRDQKYEAALDLMKRAQALFDAPVHVLYIARSERELGRWVEAAETFRALSKQSLPDDAPEQFQAAVGDAGRELAELEPRIPRLVIQLDPAEAKATALTIDGNDVPVAVIGIERLVNPGPHTIRVETEQFEPVERTSEAKAGETATVTIDLQPVESAAAQAAVGEDDAKDEQKDQGLDEGPPPYEVMMGLRLGAVFPGSQVPSALARPGSAADSVQLNDVSGAGGELEFRAGLKAPINLGIVQRWGVHLFVSGGQLGEKALNPANNTALTFLSNQGGGINSQSSFTNAGLALSLAQQRDKFGGFVELAVMAHNLSFEYSTSEELAACDGTASATRSGSGGGARLSGGAGIPISGWGLLTPYLTFSLSQINTVTTDSNECFRDIAEIEESQEESVDDPVSHAFLGIGLGGEVFLGL